MRCPFARAPVVDALPHRAKETCATIRQPPIRGPSDCTCGTRSADTADASPPTPTPPVHRRRGGARGAARLQQLLDLGPRHGAHSEPVRAERDPVARRPRRPHRARRRHHREAGRDRPLPPRLVPDRAPAGHRATAAHGGVPLDLPHGRDPGPGCDPHRGRQRRRHQPERRARRAQRKPAGEQPQPGRGDPERHRRLLRQRQLHPA